MPRKKEYSESDVAEKAMHVFWEKGYENSTVRILENELGINQFSIYASFKNKEGLLLSAIDVYEKRIYQAVLKHLEASIGKPEDLRSFFYNFLDFVSSEQGERRKGCLLINTIQELEAGDEKVRQEILRFTAILKRILSGFLRKGKAAGHLNPELDVEKYANYLLGVIHGLSTSCKHFSRDEIEDYIDLAIKNIT